MDVFGSNYPMMAAVGHSATRLSQSVVAAWNKDLHRHLDVRSKGIILDIAANCLGIKMSRHTIMRCHAIQMDIEDSSHFLLIYPSIYFKFGDEDLLSCSPSLVDATGSSAVIVGDVDARHSRPLYVCTMDSRIWMLLHTVSLPPPPPPLPPSPSPLNISGGF